MNELLSGHKKETLENHIKDCMYVYDILKKDTNFKQIINNNIYCNGLNSDVIEDIIDHVIEYHDYGKLNPYFQQYIRTGIKKKNTEHSKLSCIKYINDMYTKYILNMELANLNKREIIHIKNVISVFILNCSYNILKHHNRNGIQNMPDYKIYIEDLIDYYTKNKDCFEFINIDIKNLEYFKTKSKNISEMNNPIVGYLIFKLNYAMLVKSDYLSVYKYYHNKDLKDNRIDNNVKYKYINDFNNNDIVSNIYKFKNGQAKLSTINQYRANMFLESENILLDNINEYVFYLEAPTGSGKSTIAVNLSLKLLDSTHSKIIYTSPSNNVSEQMYDGFKNYLQDSNNIALINSRQSIITTDEYSKDYLNYQTFNYPIVITSHVKLFNILFGNNRNDILALDSLRNSILILDEVQNYKNKIWINFINSFLQISKIYNIKIIIMSATLPKMDKLIFDENRINTVDLIKNTKYYFDFFKNRVIYNYDLLDRLNKNEKNDKDEVLEYIKNIIDNSDKHRILIESLSTKTCEYIYDRLKEYEEKGFLVYKMLSITNLKTRENIINNIQIKNKDNTYKNDKVILIGTQCIEAGIDIDMNIGFKDISILDFDEQFIGRIERNFYDTGICYFFDLDNEDYIYKDDYRIEFNLKNSKKYRELFEKKDFHEYYLHNYEWLIKYENKQYDKYLKDLNDSQYENINKDMQLINNATYSFLFIDKLKTNNKIYCCENIRNNIHNIKNTVIDYAEKEIKLKDEQMDLNNFVYSIPTYKFKEEPHYIKENGYYIVEDGLKYFDNTDGVYLTDKSNLNLDMFVNYTGLYI